MRVRFKKKKASSGGRGGDTCGINRELTQFACSASFLVCVCVRVSVRVDGKRTVDTAAGGVGGGGCLLKKTKQHCKCTDFSRSSGVKVLTRSRGSPSSAKLNDLRVLQRREETAAAVWRWLRLARWRRRLRQSPRRRPPPPAAHASPLGEHRGQNCGSVFLFLVFLFAQTADAMPRWHKWQ